MCQVQNVHTQPILSLTTMSTITMSDLEKQWKQVKDEFDAVKQLLQTLTQAEVELSHAAYHQKALMDYLSRLKTPSVQLQKWMQSNHLDQDLIVMQELSKEIEELTESNNRLRFECNHWNTTGYNTYISKGFDAWHETAAVAYQQTKVESILS